MVLAGVKVRCLLPAGISARETMSERAVRAVRGGAADVKCRRGANGVSQHERRERAWWLQVVAG